MIDIHRHDEYSTFDGFGNAVELASLAKELGYTALGLSNHGNTNGLVQHHFACKSAGIKPILGVEMYFQPAWNKEKPRHHLCLFVKNLEGYSNMNKLMLMGEKQKYYKPIITFKDLKKHNKGLICSSACIAGFISQCIVAGNIKMACKAAKQFKKIFGEDFYIEIQPYKISEKGLQEKVNIELIKIAKKLDIKCIFTSDSHYGAKEDWETYLKMHEIGKTRYDVKATYGERYMPAPKDFGRRFIKMHKKDFRNIKELTREMYSNMDELDEKIQDDILGKLELRLPQFAEGKDTFPYLLQQVKRGLKKRKKWNKKYWARCKQELKIIKMHGFDDYFLIVQDYVNWAKEHGIAVGPGRGSVCNCEVAYALGITDVDSLSFNLDFRRFLREDKKKMPDIDLDFETARRQEVIEYILQRYKGHSAQICSYGNYMVDNLINDLAKVCSMDDEDEIKRLKVFVKEYCPNNSLDYASMSRSADFMHYNRRYDNILVHFKKMFKKVRYIGTHAAGVAITGTNITDYAALKIDKKTGNYITVYNLADLENINVLKFDILGLSTMGQIGEIRKYTGETFQDDWLNDTKVYKAFKEGDTDGVFQFESGTAKQILQDIQCDCFEDVIAASSMNRPGPLALRQPEQYAHNKFNREDAMDSTFWDYTKETYGTIVYQEQLQQICINIGGMSWADADRTMKCLKNVGVEAVKKQVEADKKELTKIFVQGAVKNGFNKQEAKEMFANVLVYTFNKGHGAGYSLISYEEMYNKIYHPTVFWCTKLKYAKNYSDRYKYAINAVKSGNLLMLPHVNYNADYCLREVDGETVIQEGTSSIKFVGTKAADIIEKERKKNGPFKSYDDFIARCKGRVVNKRSIEKLNEYGALEFNKQVYLDRVVKYNSTLYAKGMN